MYRTLLKKQFMEIFRNYFVDSKTGKARTSGGTKRYFLLYAAILVCVAFSFYAIASDIAAGTLGFGSDWFYYSLVGLLSIAIGVFGSVFSTYQSLYLPKDNDFIMTLPVPVHIILLSRITVVYLMSLIYSAWLWIPSMAASWAVVPANAANIVMQLVIMFFIALFSTVLTCILGFFVAAVVKKTKGKSIVTVLLTVVFLAAYYVVYFRIINSLGDIGMHMEELSGTVRSWLHYIYFIGTAADGNVLSLLAAAGITVLLFAACLFVLSKTFLRIVLPDGTAPERKKTAEAGSFGEKTAESALLLREFRHFGSVSTWMLNGGIGIIILPAAGIFALFRKNDIAEMQSVLEEAAPQILEALPCLILAAICLIVSTNVILPVTISIEGRNLWILKSLPIEPWDVISAKERMGVILDSVPAIAASVLFGIAFKLGIADILVITAASLSYVLMISDFGIYLNLRNPSFAWTNEAYLCKQSMPVTFALFGGWGICAVFGVAALFLTGFMPATLVIALYAVIFAAVWLYMRNYLRTKGTVLFSDL